MTTAPRRLKPAYWLAAALTMIVAGLLLVRPASAGNSDNPLANVPFELRLDLAKAYQSPVGSTIMKYVRQAKPNADELMDGLVETLGLDPRTAVSTLVLRGQGINEMDLQLIADLGNSAGKLEGWMLGLPGYESEDLDGETLLHSFFINDNPEHDHHADHEIDQGHDGGDVHRLFVALPERDGKFQLVASFTADETTALAQSVRGGEAILDDADALQGDQIMRLSLADLSKHNLPQGAPGSAVLESIAGLTLTLGSGDNVTANMVMNTATPARARQVTQLLQGLVALTQLAALEQPEMQQLANLLGDVKIAQLNGEATSGGPGVTASFSGSHAEFEKWVDWFAQQAK